MPPFLVSTLTVELPPDLSPERARLLLAVQLFREDEVSLGYAAEMAGCSVGTFAETLSRHRVPVIDHPVEDLDAESGALNRLSGGREGQAA